MSSNILITGSPGIGKTACCKFILREMENFSERIYGIYVNCWKQDSAYKVLVDICHQLGYKWTLNKKTNELMDEIAKIVNKKSAVIILDEVDKLKEEQVIYQLLEDLFKKCLILITNNKEFLATLDQRTRSRLIPEILEFNPYSFKETYDILYERKKFAFFEGVFPEDLFEQIAQKAFHEKDIRIGLFLLKETGNATELRSSKKISQEDIDKALTKVFGYHQTKLTLDEEELEILNFIKNNPGQPSPAIYLLYQQKFNKSDRTFRRKISTLKESDLIEVQEEIINGIITPHFYPKASNS
jgi:cell division control protein 6